MPLKAQAPDIRIMLVQVEFERVKFIIEKYAQFVTPNADVQRRLTVAERDHPSWHAKITDQHFYLSVLQSLPEAQAHLDDTLPFHGFVPSLSSFLPFFSFPHASCPPSLPSSLSSSLLPPFFPSLPSLLSFPSLPSPDFLTLLNPSLPFFLPSPLLPLRSSRYLLFPPPLPSTLAPLPSYPSPSFLFPFFLLPSHHPFSLLRSPFPLFVSDFLPFSSFSLSLFSSFLFLLTFLFLLPSFLLLACSLPAFLFSSFPLLPCPPSPLQVFPPSLSSFLSSLPHFHPFLPLFLLRPFLYLFSLFLFLSFSLFLFSLFSFSFSFCFVPSFLSPHLFPPFLPCFHCHGDPHSPLPSSFSLPLPPASHLSFLPFLRPLPLSSFPLPVLPSVYPLPFPNDPSSFLIALPKLIRYTTSNGTRQITSRLRTRIDKVSADLVAGRRDARHGKEAYLTHTVLCCGTARCKGGG